MRRHSSRSWSPAAEWMALSMQPWQGTKQPSSRLLAALTMASARSRVVPPPERQPGLGGNGGQGGPVHHAPRLPLGGEQGVLHRQEVRRQGHGRPHVHQGAEQPPLGGLPGGKFRRRLPVLGQLGQQPPVEKLDLFHAVHGSVPPIPAAPPPALGSVQGSCRSGGSSPAGSHRGCPDR